MTKHEILSQFLARFPAASLSTMSLEQYTQAGSKETFCYWLEATTEDLGSIWGGSGFKFGVYSRKNTEPKESSEGLLFDARYGWYSKYGNTPDEAFATVRAIIVSIVDAAQRGDLDTLEAIAFSPMIKWKLAFLYQDHSQPILCAIYLDKALRYLAYSEDAKRQPLAECYRRIMKPYQPGQDLFDYSAERWREWDSAKVQVLVTGLVASDSSHWMEDMQKGMAEGKKGVAWWSKMPSGGGDVLKQLKQTVEDGECFDFYLSRGQDLVWKLSVCDIATKDTYDALKWGDAYSLEKNFTDYVDGTRKASIAFLVNAVEKLEPPLSMSHVVFYKNAQAPRQNNLQPLAEIRKMPPATNTSLSAANALAEPAATYSASGTLKPKNIILYGPPGTGKTYETRRLALELLQEAIPSARSEQVVLYKRLIEEKRIAFTTFHQSLAYEEFVEGIRPRNTGAGITYEERPGIFVELCREAQRNWLSATTHSPVSDFSEVWEAFCDELDEQGEIKVTTPKAHFMVTEVDGSTIRFNKQNGQSNHTLSVSTLQGIFEGSREIAGGLFTYYSGLNNFLKTRQSATSSRPVESLKQYVLIIDEINRANVSKVLGELITLLEPSKRLGMPEELTAILPYSGTRFGVPPNLHLIGTMNTADRSIALMDTALRRRFEFRELMPKPELIPGNDGSGTIPADEGKLIDLRAMLSVINDRLKLLLHRDSTLGHAFFMDVRTFEDLKDVLLRQVIPLLQEYFYSDWRRIQLVLGDLLSNEEQSSTPIVKGVSLDESAILGFDEKDARSRMDYSVVKEQDLTPDAIIKIYQGSVGNP